MTGFLWPHQEEALERMRDRCVLYGGVGSGKSRTAVAYWLRHAGKQSGYDRLVVITTAMKRDSLEWWGDLAAFGISMEDTRVTIDSWNNIGKYTDVTGSFFIFDEQRIVGYGAWSKAFLKIAKNNPWVVLTATPGDTWMDYLTVFIANGFFKNKSDFERKHVVYDRFAKYPKVRAYLNEFLLEGYRKETLVPMHVERHTTRHVIEESIGYDVDRYHEGSKRRCDPLTGERLLTASAFCYFQRRVVNSDPGRLDRLAEIVRERQQVVVFYTFNYELEMLRTIGDLCGVTVLERNGHRHDPPPSDASSGWVYLVQYSSGSEAWNCIATDTMVFYSRTYSWKVREQAMGRIDRANTPFKDLYYYEFTSSSSIDAGISKAISRKKAFNESAYAKDFGVVGSV